MSDFELNNKFYKFISWDKGETIDDIMVAIEWQYKNGWKVVSHSHSVHGMSVILKKRLNKK